MSKTDRARIQELLNKATGRTPESTPTVEPVYIERAAPGALPIDFTRDDIVHHQIYRKGIVAIYTVTRAYLTYFEVILVQCVDGVESYPSDMSWGYCGWTYADLADAQRKAEFELMMIETD